MMAREPAEGVLDLHVSFDQAPELERSEVYVPDTVVDLLQADVFADADGGDVEPSPIPADATVGTDVAHFEAVGILQRRKFLGHLARGGAVAGSGSLLVQRLVRSFVVELFAKDIELSLLRGEVCGGRARGLVFESSVHALVPPVLLRFPRLDQFRQDAQAHPPGREAGESGQGVGGKGYAVVGADTLGEPIFP